MRLLLFALCDSFHISAIHNAMATMAAGPIAGAVRRSVCRDMIMQFSMGDFLRRCPYAASP
jgi:hypothetical protein